MIFREVIDEMTCNCTAHQECYACQIVNQVDLNTAQELRLDNRFQRRTASLWRSKLASWTCPTELLNISPWNAEVTLFNVVQHLLVATMFQLVDVYFLHDVVDVACRHHMQKRTGVNGSFSLQL